jgi:hypothetical protein
LGAHKVIPLSPETTNKIGMWSCRFWALYVILYYVQLYQEYQALVYREKKIQAKISKDASEKDTQVKSQLARLQDEKQTFYANLVMNTAYFPMTIVRLLLQKLIELALVDGK